MNSLAEIAREVLSPLAAPASFLHSQLIGPEELEGDVDESGRSRQVFLWVKR